MRLFVGFGVGVAAALSCGTFAGTLTWKNRLPSERTSIEMVYDSTRHKAVTFGGELPAVNAYSGETWEWDGAAWTQRLVAGPSARASYALAYDPVRQVTVLFGGINTSGYNAETWEWDGETWTNRNVTGPSARSESKMCFDATRNVVVLFGGWDQTYLSDTWEWDGNSWTKRDVAGPGGRRAHTFTFDSARGNAVLYGGLRQNLSNGQPIVSNDTWIWNGTAWSQSAAIGPQALYSGASAFDSARGMMVLYGGRLSTTNSGTTNQTWEWNGASWTQRSSFGLSGRSGHAMAYVPESAGVIVFAGPVVNGSTELERSDTQRWNGTDWTTMAAKGPRSRTGLTMVYDSVRERTVAATGYYSSVGDFLSIPDAWEWDGLTWKMQGGAPSLYRGGMVFDSGRGVTVFFGGVNDSGAVVGTTWEYNGIDGWVNRGVTGPSARAFPAMAYDSARHVVVLFGGASGNWLGALGETWEWDGIAWTQRIVSGPSPRIGASMAYDSARGVTVLFGGRPSSGPFSAETWEWNGIAWTQRVVPGPQGRSEAGMAYDAARGKTVLFGGWNSSTLVTDTWEWDGSAWTQLPISGPTAGWSGGMVYDSARKSVVVFGGASTTVPYGSEIWELTVDCPADLNQDHLVDDSDFTIFAGAYNILECTDPGMPSGCPSDFNRDGLVDDSDFTIFVAAYNDLLCP